MRLNVDAGFDVARVAVPRPFAAGAPTELPVAVIGSASETALKMSMSRFPPVTRAVVSVTCPDASGWYEEALLWNTPWPVNPTAKLPPSSETAAEHAAAGGTHCW